MNIVTQIGSGTPYSGYKQAAGEALLQPGTSQLDGSLNGSRKPWQYRVDLQLDRNFMLEFGDDENKKKAAYLNVYCRVNETCSILSMY